MRVERTTNPQFHKCWLTTDEYDQLCRATGSYRDKLDADSAAKSVSTGLLSNEPLSPSETHSRECPTVSKGEYGVPPIHPTAVHDGL
jgi:hypothetical protein